MIDPVMLHVFRRRERFHTIALTVPDVPRARRLLLGLFRVTRCIFPLNSTRMYALSG